MTKAVKDNPVVLITGAAKRIGAEVARFLHANNFNVIIHYRRSQNEAEQLVASLNHIRENSQNSCPFMLVCIAKIITFLIVTNI